MSAAAASGSRSGPGRGDPEAARACADPCAARPLRPMAELVLASTSTYRRDLLGRLGVKFECVAPAVDEDAIRKGTKDPIGLARSLAKKKAEAVAQEHKKAIVIGCDQVIALGD